MPLGWTRINAKTSPPNKNIVFIKPRSGPDEAKSQEYLERIAAQCLPIMNKHHLAVVSLEEYEPNREFWGRNFNNGEVIQLVLKSPTSGHWLPFKFVQLVMMHELAHNKQMNHSGAFWKVRNEFTDEMKALWTRGYTGDGLWGRGMMLENGEFEGEELPEGELLPEHLCGGTFRSRNRKRKAKPQITHKERQERRILKKFGKNGVALGEDEEAKTKLEEGKIGLGKPRVAGSKRGRELRAAAALARFEVKKEEPQIKDGDLVTDSEAESEDEVAIKLESGDALDLDGTKLLDGGGRGLHKVCEDEGDDEDDNMQRELSELQNLNSRGKSSLSAKPSKIKSIPPSSLPQSMKPSESTSFTSRTTKPVQTPKDIPVSKKAIGNTHVKAESVDDRRLNKEQASQRKIDMPRAPSAHLCPTCSFENDPPALTCAVCANVLRPESVVGSWKCKSAACEGSTYINAGDVGLCGVCGARP